MLIRYLIYLSFCFIDPPTPEIYTSGHTLSLHDALPISITNNLNRRSALTAFLFGDASASLPGSTLQPFSKGQFSGRHLELLTKSRSEEHTSELQSLMRFSYAVFCLKQKTTSPGPRTLPLAIGYTY